MSPEQVVQAQLDAYNARDLERFVACYHQDVMLLDFPSMRPILQGKEALSAHYRDKRFNLAALHAELVSRTVHGKVVIDRERVTGVRPEPVDAVAIYHVEDGLIRTVWFVVAVT